MPALVDEVVARQHLGAKLQHERIAVAVACYELVIDVSGPEPLPRASRRGAT